MTLEVRVVSKRKGGIEPTFAETVIDIDRTHPVLGNPFVLHNHNDDEERDRVIEAYEKKLDADIARQGPMYQALQDLTKRAQQGELLALRCWCAPKRCHGDALRERIFEFANEPLPKSTQATKLKQGSLF